MNNSCALCAESRKSCPSISFNCPNLSHRSCDLDEWTADQLDIMRLGGNGNAKLYLKKHGVPESQMTVRFKLLDDKPWL